MKKVLSVALACILMLAILTPCMAAELKSIPKTSGSVVLGAWPQSLVTSEKEIDALNAKWKAVSLPRQQAVLPDGSVIRYEDVHFRPFSDMMTDRPTYRVVCVDGAVQWYRWEPLTWEWTGFQNVMLLVCTSVVSATPYSGANPVQKGDPAAAAIYAWLVSEFYNTAFSAADKTAFHAPTVPLYSLTNGSVADVGDYAALFGADGSKYLQMLDPEAPEASAKPDADKPDVSVVEEDPYSSTIPPMTGQPLACKSVAKSAAKSTAKTAPAPVKAQAQSAKTEADWIGIRPMLVVSETYAGGIISWILHLFGW